MNTIFRGVPWLRRHFLPFSVRHQHLWPKSSNAEKAGDERHLVGDLSTLLGGNKIWFVLHGRRHCPCRHGRRSEGSAP